jgi:hypothetical protein
MDKSLDDIFRVGATLAVALFYGRRKTCIYNYVTERAGVKPAPTIMLLKGQA